MKPQAALLLACLLAGCALFPLGEAECRGVNWRERGYADGFGGHPPQYLRLAGECARRFGAEVSEPQYYAGWADGHDEWDRLMGSIDKDR